MNGEVIHLRKDEEKACHRCRANFDLAMTAKQKRERAVEMVESLSVTVENLLKMDTQSRRLYRKMIKAIIKNPSTFVRRARAEKPIVTEENFTECDQQYLTLNEFMARCKVKYIRRMIELHPDTKDLVRATDLHPVTLSNWKKKLGFK